MAEVKEQDDHQLCCRDCLLLEPEKSSPSDVIRLLFSNNEPESNRLYGSTPPAQPDHRLSDQRRRWLLFVSMFLQKILLWAKAPMTKVGYWLDECLNLLPSNGGFLSLFLNFFKGKIVKPDRSSAEFRSKVGNLDGRIELDKRISKDDNRYKPALSIMASKLAYENEACVRTVITDHWKMKFLDFQDYWNEYQNQYSTTAIMLQDSTSDPNLIVVAFKGTEMFDADNWRSNIDISWYEIEGVGKVHAGFMKALGLQRSRGWPRTLLNGDKDSSNIGYLTPFAYYEIRDRLKHLMKENEKAKYIVTGHSLGGALAILFASVLTLHQEEWLLDRMEGVYTFGQPRVGDEQFGEYMKENLMKCNNVKYRRYVYCNDVVPRLPYDDKTFMFKHFGACLYYNRYYHGEVLEEEPNKNYFSLLWVIPKSLNAVGELIRSFIIPYTKGPDYREGWLMRSFRLIGLVIPGLSAHFTQDYVNLTRLGSLSPTGHFKKI